jgi:hypothetical protein
VSKPSGWPASALTPAPGGATGQSSGSRYHHKRDSIEAHPTIVFSALAVTRWLERQTGWSTKKLITALRSLPG